MLKSGIWLYDNYGHFYKMLCYESECPTTSETAEVIIGK